jgi:hypothetical protein
MAVTVKDRPLIVAQTAFAETRLRTRTAPVSVMQIIEQAKQNLMSAGELTAENARLMAYGAGQAKKAGIEERDILRITHDARSRRRVS